MGILQGTYKHTKNKKIKHKRLVTTAKLIPTKRSQEVYDHPYESMIQNQIKEWRNQKPDIHLRDQNHRSTLAIKELE